MRPGSVGKQRRIVPVGSLGVKNRQPGLFLRIEAAGRDGGKRAGLDCFAILSVDIQQFLDGRLPRGAALSRARVPAATPANR